MNGAMWGSMSGACVAVMQYEWRHEWYCSMIGVHLTYQQHECNSMRCAMCGRMNGAMPNSMSGAMLQHEWRHKVRHDGNRDN